MYVASPRRRHGADPPNPIRIRRHANSPLFAGRSPVPWSPLQPSPPSGRSADFQPFPVSPESTTTDDEHELSPSGSRTPMPTPWPTGMSPETVEAGGGSRRDSVESRTGGVPETPVGTPVEGFMPVGVAMAARGHRGFLRGLRRVDEFYSSPTSPLSPRWRDARQGASSRTPDLKRRNVEYMVSDEESKEAMGYFSRLVEIADGTEGDEETVSGEDRDIREALGRSVVEAGDEDVSGNFKQAGIELEGGGTRGRGGYAQAISWWKYPWIVIVLVLFMLFVPSMKEMS